MQEKKCPGCGTELEQVRNKVPLGYQSGGLLQLFDDSFYVDVYRCAQCTRVELYETAPFVPSTLICPKCGNLHSIEIDCPHCAKSSGDAPPQTDRKKNREPPWER